MGSRSPVIDEASGRLNHQVLGNKGDAAITLVGTTKSVIAYLKGILGSSAITIAIDEADIDIDQADYTAFVILLTIVPASGAPLSNVQIVIDLAKATDGFAATHTSQTIQFAIARKVDGTNWRTDAEQVTTAISGTNAAGSSVTLNIGAVGVSEEVRVMVVLSAENAVDVELPFALAYSASAAPTITPVAAV